MIAEINAMPQNKKAASPLKSGLSENWLPE